MARGPNSISEVGKSGSHVETVLNIKDMKRIVYLRVRSRGDKKRYYAREKTYNATHSLSEIIK